jgi:hypothetical protein
MLQRSNLNETRQNKDQLSIATAQPVKKSLKREKLTNTNANERTVKTVLRWKLCNFSVSHRLRDNDDTDGNTSNEIGNQPLFFFEEKDEAVLMATVIAIGL